MAWAASGLTWEVMFEFCRQLERDLRKCAAAHMRKESVPETVAIAHDLGRAIANHAADLSAAPEERGSEHRRAEMFKDAMHSYLDAAKIEKGRAETAEKELELCRTVTALCCKLKLDTGKGCSVCGQVPVVNVSGTYWLCGPCVDERITMNNGGDSK